MGVLLTPPVPVFLDRSQSPQALASGNADAALALAVGAANFMNAAFPAASPPGQGSSGDLPPGDGAGERAGLREGLLTLIGEAVLLNAAPDQAALQATANAIAAVVGAPEELTPQAQDQAISLLGSIASQGDLVTAATATSVAAGLSGVVSSVGADVAVRRRRRLAEAGGRRLVDAAPAPADPRFGSVMDVVSGLAGSIGMALSVPGEEAVSITSSALQARAPRSSAACPLPMAPPFFCLF